MNLAQRIKLLTPPNKNVNKVKGQWFNIRLCPDLATGELLNIGVAVIVEDRIHVRLLNHVDRLSCLYDERISLNELTFFTDLIEEYLDGARNPDVINKSFSPHLVFGDLKFASGPTVAAILDNLYLNTVTLAKPKEAIKKEIFKSIKTDDVRKEVLEKLTLKMGIEAAQLVSEDSRYFIKGDDGYFIDLPLQSKIVIGSIVSAWYSNPFRVENNILRASSDLEIARQLFPKHGFGLFVLRPDKKSGLEKMKLQMIDKTIDDNIWKFHKMNIHLGVESETEHLAQDIHEWYRKVA